MPVRVRPRSWAARTVVKDGEKMYNAGGPIVRFGQLKSESVSEGDEVGITRERQPWNWVNGVKREV